ncbi:glycosyltransferase family 1 protein [Roseivirga sp. E12]|uniref:glycosyltransferase family 4 protein n=1 Tax=Roseivirga sp. E12 TaxID=2819237 RepID=UPI001ABCFE5B|nr:glycosyltransferase family 1 protein [Roseivirga sp. E12]MBO3699732.1 glycosyltransferase family 4 protein [Roseivirga sp. E12]
MKKKPRALIDAFHLFQALTGIRTYTTQLLKGIEALDSEEIEYKIYPNWRWVNETQFLRGKVNVFKKVLNHVIYFCWKQVCIPLLILFKRIDVVITTDYLLPFFKFNAKSVTVVHDTFYWELKGKYNPLWRQYFITSIRLGLDSRTHIITTTEYITEKVKKHVTNRHELSVVYQAPNDLIRVENNSLDYQKIGLPMGAKYFLHVGIFEERKNLKLLIRSFAKLLENEFYEDFYLVLAGARGVGIFHDDFQNLVRLSKELCIVERVIMPGFVHSDDLDSLYRSSFAYVFPSKEEGFGIPIVEAMKTGTPLIVSNQPALVEVAKGAALVFELENEASLHDRMIELSDVETRSELIRNGHLRAQDFTREKFTDQFSEVIFKVVEKSISG